MLSVSVLGPIELSRGDEQVRVRPGKTAELLIRLALDAGHPVRTERLIEDLWGDDAVSTSKNTLQTKVSRLRRHLGDPACLVSDRSGYTLQVEPDAVDALRALRMAASTTELLHAGDAPTALEVATEALALFRGDVLCDAGTGEWVLPHRTRLDEARLHLVEDQVTARMELGATAEVIGDLEALVAQHPTRERLWALLITALYRAGRQADALAAYRRVREQLVDELGIDPGPELQTLEQQVLTQDSSLEAPAPDRVAAALHGNIPTSSTPLVGRTADLQRVVDLTSASRVVAIVGPAGVGKTSLAIEAARQADAAWLVRLEDASSPASVIDAIGTALGLHGATDAMLVARLRVRDATLVLDNCEHVVAAVAALVPRLLAEAPELRVLATSQVPLGIPDETTCILEPLPLEDSIELFAQRAGERRDTFALDRDTAPTVEEICRSLDGLPLAIELAAARIKVLSVEQIARRLDDRFALLSDPTSSGPERQRALEAAIAWSYELLFPDEQRGLWALACFAGGAGLDAVEAVLEALEVPRSAALDVVTRLADRSLLAVDPGVAGELRYRLLESVRTFALERLSEHELVDAARGAHARWFGDAAGEAAAQLHGHDQGRHLEVARIERANIDAALGWTATNDPLLGLSIANGFGWAWLAEGDGVVGAERIRAALHAASDAAVPDQVTAWSLVAWLEAAGDLDRAVGEADRAVALAATPQDEALSAASRLAAAFVRTQLGPPAVVLPLLDDWRRDHPASQTSWEAGISWVLTAHAALFVGDVALATTACRTARGILEPLGDDWGLAQVDSLDGFVAQAEQRFVDAVRHFERAAATCARLGFATEGFVLANLGRVLQQAGDDIAAINVLERAVQIGQATGELRVASLARVRLGRIVADLGQRDWARELLTAANGWYRASGAGGRALASRDGAALASLLLASMDATDGVGGAAERLGALRASAHDSGDTEIELLALDALALVSARAGDLDDAARLLDDADALLPAVAHWVSADDRPDRRDARALIEAAR